MILVLLHIFCDFDESSDGYKLCQGLVKQGRDLYVTTISVGVALQLETKNATEMSTMEKGSVTLLHPEYDEESEKPQPVWLAEYHKKYFSYLSELDDVKFIIGTLPGTEKTAIDLSKTLNNRLILLASTNLQTNYFQELRTEAEQVCEIWSVGAKVHDHNHTLFQEIFPAFSTKHQNISVQSPISIPDLMSPPTVRKVILVLLPRFRESPDSVLGYQLCLHLIQQGKELCVTTTSVDEGFKSETRTAKELTRKFPGRITIVPVQTFVLDQFEHHVYSVRNLHKVPNVDTVIGLLPMTARTAMELKRVLKCKLVLLVTSKLPKDHIDLQEDVRKFAEEFDEIWSVGSDTYMYYESLFKNSHKAVLLQPTTTAPYYWEINETMPHKGIKTFISIWKKAIHTLKKAKRSI